MNTKKILFKNFLKAIPLLLVLMGGLFFVNQVQAKDIIFDGNINLQDEYKIINITSNTTNPSDVATIDYVDSAFGALTGGGESAIWSCLTMEGDVCVVGNNTIYPNDGENWKVSLGYEPSSNPAAVLDVEGNIETSGNVTAGGANGFMIGDSYLRSGSANVAGSATVTGDLTVSGASTNFRNAIKAVDGSGSGLDADLFDGRNSDDFIDDDGDTMNGYLVFPSSSRGIIQHLSSTSNYGPLARWYKGGVSQATYDPQIGQHNTGGTGTGSITILPYPTETSPWGGSVGLFITEGTIAYKGNTIWHAGNDGSGSGLDADLLDGISSGSVLRSDTTDNYTSGTLTFNSGTELDMASGATLDINGSIALPTTGISGAGSGSGLDADLLDGVSSGSFLRSDTSDYLTSGSLYLGGGTTYSIQSDGDADLRYVGILTNPSSTYPLYVNGNAYLTGTTYMGTTSYYVDTSGNANFLSLAAPIINGGTGSFTGTVSVAPPTASGHAATKGYVDSVISPFGEGDVVGPGSSTDNAVARFNGTSGKILQNSGVIIDDSNNMIVDGNLTVSGNNLTASGLNLTDQTYTLHENVRTFENVAHYYNGSTPNTGTIVVTIGSTPNIMLEAEIVVQGYGGLTKCQVRGYTYTGSASWHEPAGTCISSGHSGGYTIRFGKRTSDNARVILIGNTTSSWGSYPHAAVTRVTYGYPGSGSSIGEWSISMVTDESAYSNIVGVNENSGFNAYHSTFSGNTNFPSGIWNSSGNVGIKDATPTEGTLTVAGTGSFTGTVSVATPTASSHAATKGYVDGAIIVPDPPDGYIGNIQSHEAGGSLAMGTHTLFGSSFSIPNSGYTYFNSGNVGIGMASPSSKLEVSGNVELTNLYDNDATNFFDGSGTASKTLTAISSTGALTFSNISISTSQVTSGEFAESRIRKLDSKDTRSTNYEPQTYTSSLQTDFKQNATDGLSDGGSYHGVISYRPYGTTTDWSGGPMHQLAFTGNKNMWLRTSTGSTTWDSWRQIATNGMTNTFTFGGYAAGITPTASGHLATKGYVDSMIGDSDWAGVGGDPTLTGEIYHTGNVGIGVADPYRRLDVSGGGLSVFDNADEGIFFVSDTVSWSNAEEDTIFSYQYTTEDIFNFYTNGNIVARFQGNNMGVGTSSNPQYKLDVSGTGRFTGALYTNANIEASNPVNFIGGGTEDILTIEGRSLIKRYTANGGVRIGADDAMVIGDGESPITVAANVSMSGEQTYITSDNNIYLVNNLQNGWGSRNEIEWEESGELGINTTDPNYTLDVSGTGRFTGNVIVATPTADNHAVTKEYVDGAIVPADGYIGDSQEHIAGGNLIMRGTYLNIDRSQAADSGIQWYSSGYNAWADYMAPSGTGMGPKGNLTAPSGSLVSSWALRSFIENGSGYGWTFESGTSSDTTPDIVAEIRSSDGSMKIGGNFDVAGGEITSANKIESDTNATFPYIYLDSTGGGDEWTSQGAHISIGESGDLGAASLHMTYVGNGYGYIGSGAVSSGIPGSSYFRFDYDSSNIYSPDVLTLGNDLFVNDFARIDALRVGNTSTDPGDKNIYVEGDATVIGKLTAGEVDPPYSIDGTIYATYGHSTTGLKEETVGKLRLQETRNKKQEIKLYSVEIDFDEAEKGSDLWLFNEVSAFGEDWNDLVVSLTPEGKADVWYEFIPEENKLIIYGNQPIKVSYRLMAPRFDWPERDTNLYNQTGEAPEGVGIFIR